jgi:nicotinamide riboside kinase
MKIALSGAQSTGKTTLLKLLKKEFENYEFIGEIVRNLKNKHGISINQKGNFSSQLLIFQAHIENLDKEDFISDRCILDAFVYTEWSFQKGIFNENEYQIFKDIFLKNIFRYNIIFYIPVEFKLKKDGFRDEDLNFQKEIDELFLKILLQYKIDYKKITGGKEERLNQILTILNQIK